MGKNYASWRSKKGSAWKVKFIKDAGWVLVSDKHVPVYYSPNFVSEVELDRAVHMESARQLNAQNLRYFCTIRCFDVGFGYAVAEARYDAELKRLKTHRISEYMPEEEANRWFEDLCQATADCNLALIETMVIRLRSLEPPSVIGILTLNEKHDDAQYLIRGYHHLGRTFREIIKSRRTQGWYSDIEEQSVATPSMTRDAAAGLPEGRVKAAALGEWETHDAAVRQNKHNARLFKLMLSAIDGCDTADAIAFMQARSAAEYEGWELNFPGELVP